MLISSIYRRPATQKNVRIRRINRETMRQKLAKASFISVPRLVKVKLNVPPAETTQQVSL